jgi:hypothetical protein
VFLPFSVLISDPQTLSYFPPFPKLAPLQKAIPIYFRADTIELRNMAQVPWLSTHHCQSLNILLFAGNRNDMQRQCSDIAGTSIQLHLKLSSPVAKYSAQ